MHARVVCCLTLTACHVTSHTQIRRPRDTKQIEHPEGAIARRPTLVLTDTGALRFVEPLECPTEEVVTETRATETVRGPNLATFVVGMIATAVGGIMLVRGANDDEGASNPFTYAGAGLVAVGLPFTVGPWIGNGTELHALEDVPPVRRPGQARPCGERGLTAKSATLAVRGIEVFGRIDASGVFSISPFEIADAFEAKTATAAWDVSAKVDAPTGARTVNVVLEMRALAAHADAFLSSADFDPKIETLRLVPGIVPGTLRVSLTQTPEGPAARIVLAIKNDGPGPAYALRGHIAAPGTRALDGRVLYFGRVAKGGSLTRELLVPLSPVAADALRNATIDLALELRDAHGTAPPTPVRFRGAILVDAPR
ncbi:MAG: hypothetical protein M4D80_19595 [Myxococcota bacterium]|nr:hypothetical protein [Myxococcota bacterium]